MSASTPVKFKNRNNQSSSLPLQQFCLTLDKEGIREAFGNKAESRSDWRKIYERALKLNSISRRFKIIIVAKKRETKVRLYSSSKEAVLQFVEHLRTRQGAIQGLFSEALAKRMGGILDRRTIPDRMRENQLAFLKTTLMQDIGIFSCLDPDKLWLDFGSRQNNVFMSRLEEVEAFIKANPKGKVLLIGEASSGKTSFLYRLLKSWPSLNLWGRDSAYLNAKHLRFDWLGGMTMWAGQPGFEAFMQERLEESVAAGQLHLLIDGLQENPICLDFSNPAVRLFWQAVQNNSLVLAMTPEFYETAKKRGLLEEMGQGPVHRVLLPAWEIETYQKMLQKLAIACAGSDNAVLREVAPRISRLPAQDLVQQARIRSITPLVGFALANYIAAGREGQMPRSEFEFLDYMRSYLIRHTAAKANALWMIDIADAILVRIAWEAYRRCMMGIWRALPIKDAMSVVKDCVPYMEDKHSEIFLFLMQLPFIECDQQGGWLLISQPYDHLLAAKYILRVMVSGDYKGARETVLVPWRYNNVSRYLFQALARLPEEEKKKYFGVCQILYKTLWSDCVQSDDPSLETSITQTIHPLGFIDLPEVRDFLWNALNEAQGKKELVYLAAAMSLGWSGEKRALAEYVYRLKNDPKASRFNLTYFQFYRREDAGRIDFPNFTPEMTPNWERTCDWLLYTLSMKDCDFYYLWPLYGFTMCNFLRAKGLGPFLSSSEGNGTGLIRARERRDAIKKIIEMWKADSAVLSDVGLREILAAMEAAAREAEVCINGGDPCEEKEKEANQRGQKNNPVCSKGQKNRHKERSLA